MKHPLPILLLFLCPILLKAQQPVHEDSLRAMQWLFGYAPENGDPLVGGSLLDFRASPLVPDTFPIPFSFDRLSTIICDQNGEILLYTNGIYIGNGLGDTIINGTGLNPGIFADDFANWGYPLSGGALILPFPEHPDLYILLHERYDYFNNNQTISTLDFFFSVIDISTQNGVVLSKNNTLLQDTLDVGKIGAVRHANGRDWWILNAEFDKNSFHTFLLSPQGVDLQFSQEIGNPIQKDAGIGQAVFSLKGDQYARNDGNLLGGPHLVQLFDFDRCAGTLSNYREAIIPDSSFSSGLAFSPSGQFLYAAVTNKLYQFDTQASDLQASMQLIAEWSGAYSPFPPFRADFAHLALGPDHKIYICHAYTAPSLHVIEFPDLPGASCGFSEMGVLLPTFNKRTMPNLPNFRLAHLPASPCDTLSPMTPIVELPNENLEESWRIQPNPVGPGQMVELHFTAPYPQPLQAQIMNNQGQTLHTRSIPPNTTRINVSTAHLQPGIYWIILEHPSGKRSTQKLVVAR